MSKFIITTLMLCISTLAMSQIKIPAISPTVEITQQLGLTTITLSYSRPSLRGRGLIGTGGILQLDELWRTGANAATKIEVSSDILISAKQLPKGSYALLSTPHRDNWSFHFYPYTSSSHTSYIDQEPLLTVTAPVAYQAHPVESLSIHLEALTIDGAHLVLEWGDRKVSLPILLSEHELIMRGIDSVLDGPSSIDYFQAALYLHESETDLPLALQYIQQATADEAARFFMVYREALILRDLGKNEAAIKAARRSVILSQKAGNTDIARLSQRIVDELSDHR